MSNKPPKPNTINEAHFCSKSLVYILITYITNTDSLLADDIK